MNLSLLNVINNLAKTKNLLSKKEENEIFLTVYIESQCPDTTYFIKRQLIPTFENLKNIKRVIYTIVPFGKAECYKIIDDFE